MVEEAVKVLILGLNFAPELIGVGKYTAEFAAWLTERGHEVRVVTAPPYYPEWRVGRGHAAWRYRRETIDGIDVWRCPLWVPARAVAGQAHPAPAVLRAQQLSADPLARATWRPDVVWAVEPTGFAAPTRAARGPDRRRRRLPARPGSRDRGGGRAAHARAPRASIAGAQSAYGWLLRRFDLVSTIAERMRRRLAAHGVAPERLCLFPNWVDTGAILPLASASRLRRKLGFGDDQVVVLYAGNMGEKQGLEGLAAVAERLADRPEIQFVLCGAGRGPSAARAPAGTAGPT